MVRIERTNLGVNLKKHVKTTKFSSVFKCKVHQPCEHPRQKKRAKERPEVAEKGYSSAPKARYDTVRTILNPPESDDVSGRQKRIGIFVPTAPEIQNSPTLFQLLSRLVVAVLL